MVDQSAGADMQQANHSNTTRRTAEDVKEGRIGKNLAGAEENNRNFKPILMDQTTRPNDPPPTAPAVPNQTTFDQRITHRFHQHASRLARSLNALGCVAGTGSLSWVNRADRQLTGRPAPGHGGSQRQFSQGTAPAHGGMTVNPRRKLGYQRADFKATT